MHIPDVQSSPPSSSVVEKMMHTALKWFYDSTHSVEDPPDSFYEFTADDYARVARGWGANTTTGPAANAPLKTARMRAADAAAAAQVVGPVPVRVYGFVDDLALQATLSATDPVSALQVGSIYGLHATFMPAAWRACCMARGVEAHLNPSSPLAAWACNGGVVLPSTVQLCHSNCATARHSFFVFCLFAGAGCACVPAGDGGPAAVYRAAQGRAAAAAGACAWMGST